MGIRLIVEVLDYAPSTLSHRERLLAVVLAEDANDDTRKTWGSVQAPAVRRRASLSRTQLYEVLKGLVAHGVIKKITAGQRNATAEYVFLPLDTQGPAERDTENPSQSPESRDTDTVQSPAGRDPKGKFRVPDHGTLTDSQSPESRDAENSQSPAGRDVSVPLDGTPTPHPSTTKRSLAPRPDVEQVCNHLADRIEANGSRKPRVTDRWRNSARLLIDQDKRTVDQILRAIDWCQADPFWRANVMSMPKLRERYDQLRLKATAEMEQQRRETEREAARTARRDPTTTYAERGIF